MTIFIGVLIYIVGVCSGMFLTALVSANGNDDDRIGNEDDNDWK